MAQSVGDYFAKSYSVRTTSEESSSQSSMDGVSVLSLPSGVRSLENVMNTDIEELNEDERMLREETFGTVNWMYERDSSSLLRTYSDYYKTHSRIECTTSAEDRTAAEQEALEMTEQSVHRLHHDRGFADFAKVPLSLIIALRYQHASSATLRESLHSSEYSSRVSGQESVESTFPSLSREEEYSFGEQMRDIAALSAHPDSTAVSPVRSSHPTASVSGSGSSSSSSDISSAIAVSAVSPPCTPPHSSGARPSMVDPPISAMDSRVDAVSPTVSRTNTLDLTPTLPRRSANTRTLGDGMEPLMVDESTVLSDASLLRGNDEEYYGLGSVTAEAAASSAAADDERSIERRTHTRGQSSIEELSIASANLREQKDRREQQLNETISALQKARAEQPSRRQNPLASAQGQVAGAMVAQHFQSMSLASLQREFPDCTMDELERMLDECDGDLDQVYDTLNRRKYEKDIIRAPQD